MGASAVKRLTIADAHLAVLDGLARIERRKRLALVPTPATEAETRADAAKQSLAEFVRQAWEFVVPGRKLVWGWHLDAVCAELEKVTRGEIDRLILLLPPGSMKSLLVSVFWPAWEWTRNGGLRYLTFTYSGGNAVRDALAVRSLVQTPWFYDNFDTRLKADQSAKTRFNTTSGGWRISSSIGGVGTGEHPDRIIIDDPMKAQDISEQRLGKVKFWFDRTVSTRTANKPAIVVVMQRLHMGDLVGHLLAQPDEWTVVKFPMRYIPSKAPAADGTGGYEADPRDQRTEAGSLLWPELLDEKEVKRRELQMGPFGTAGQHQQNPVPEGGGLCKREWFKFCGAAPVNAVRCRGWDTGGTEGAGDYTAGVKLAEGDGLLFVENVIREQLGPFGVDSVIRGTAKLDGMACMVREEKEGGASGKAVIAARARALGGYDYKGQTISGDKMVRFKPFRAQLEAGNVYIVVTGNAALDAWIEPYIAELCALPVGVNDDQADGTSCAYNAIVAEPVVSEATWGRR